MRKKLFGSRGEKSNPHQNQEEGENRKKQRGKPACAFIDEQIRNIVFPRSEKLREDLVNIGVLPADGKLPRDFLNSECMNSRDFQKHGGKVIAEKPCEYDCGNSFKKSDKRRRETFAQGKED